MYLMLCLLMAVPDDSVVVGIGQSWYEQDKTMSQSVEGILDYQPTTGRIGIPAGFSPFRLLRKDAATGKVMQYNLHAPGSETLLAMNVGQLVKLEAKLISKGEGEARREELWIGKLQPLGAAPLNVFTEMKPIARSNRFQPTSVQITSDAAKLVIRNGKEAAKAIGFNQNEPDADQQATRYLATLFGTKNIDWKTQMVLYVGNAYQRNFNFSKIEITRMEVTEKGVTVHWKSEMGQKAAGSPYSTDTILVPRIDGEVIFKKEEDSKKDNPKEGAVPDKIVPVPPSAPVK